MLTIQLVGGTCLFLASKVEETLKKLKDVVHVTHVLRYRRSIRSQEVRVRRS